MKVRSNVIDGKTKGEIEEELEEPKKTNLEMLQEQLKNINGDIRRLNNKRLKIIRAIYKWRKVGG